MMRALDAVDKAMSRPVFRLVLPAAVEYALSPVWVFHGCPVTALALCPWVIVGASRFGARGSDRANRGDLAWSACGMIVLSAFLFVWVGLVRARSTNAMYMRERKGLMVALILSSVIAAMIFDATFDGSRLALVSFYLCAWFTAEAVVVALKVLAGRQRPGVALANELSSVPRALPALTYLHAGGETAVQSFPSGDATGAAVFATCLVLSAGTSERSACCYAVLVAFGRMYLWAHHLADVTAGCLIGALCTAVLDAALGAHNFGLVHLSAGVGVILPVYFSRTELKRFTNRTK